MGYNMNCEPVHQELFDECVHVPLEEYQPGSERLERLYAAMERAHRYSWPSSLECNV